MRKRSAEQEERRRERIAKMHERRQRRANGEEIASEIRVRPSDKRGTGSIASIIEERLRKSSASS